MIMDSRGLEGLFHRLRALCPPVVPLILGLTASKMACRWCMAINNVQSPIQAYRRRSPTCVDGWKRRLLLEGIPCVMLRAAVGLEGASSGL